jgi:hypothetical protein
MDRKMEAIPVPRSHPAKATALGRLNPAIILIYITKGNNFLNLPHFDGTITGSSGKMIAIS